MHYGIILSWLVFVLIMVFAAAMVVQGDIAVSLSQLWGWTWPKIRPIRHIRRLVNLPFHIQHHRRTRNMSVALGQVWCGASFTKTVRVIGKASNGDWVLQLTDSIQAIESPTHFRDRIFVDALYLYEWDQSINYIPTVDSIYGLKVVILKRPSHFGR